MSEEQLNAFIAKVQAETSLQEQLTAEGADVIAIAQKAGFTINTEDIKSYVDSYASELSEEELESVAGGGNIPMAWLICLGGSLCTWTSANGFKNPIPGRKPAVIDRDRNRVDKKRNSPAEF